MSKWSQQPDFDEPSINLRTKPEYLALYNIPMAELGLSELAIRTIKKLGVTTVGDAIDYFVVAHSAMISTPAEFAAVMETQIMEKLKELGYWEFYEKALR